MNFTNNHLEREMRRKPRLPLLAGYPLYDLFPRPAAAREVRRCPVN